MRINPYTRVKQELDALRKRIKLSAPVIVVLFLLFWSVLHHQQAGLKKELVAAQQETQTWKDRSGNEHARVAQLELDKQSLKKEVDSIAKVLKIKPKQIQSYAGTQIRVDTVVQPTYTERVRLDTVYLPDSSVRVDTTRTYHLQYKDSSFLSVEGEVPSKSGLRIALEARLQVTDYYKRKWFLGKKTYYTDIATDNPYITLKDAFSLKRQQKATLKIRPGIGIGATYNPLTKQLTPGISAGLYLFKSK